MHYLVRRAHAYTIEGWLKEHANRLAAHVTILPYEDLRGRVPSTGMIFTDIDRLTPALFTRACDVATRARAAGVPVLNDPARALRRYDLQRALSNDFRVFRENEIPDNVRFPVFLREENEHTANVTPLLESMEQLRGALRRFPGSLVVEFVDTSDEHQVFRKYSVMRIGDALVPRHVFFSNRWMLKEPDRVEPAFVEEELTFLKTNPHAAQVRHAFDAGHLTWGRIDYSTQGDAIQVWEINSNPTLRTPATALRDARGDAHRQSAPRINDAILAVASDRAAPVWCGIRKPRTRTKA